MKAPVCPLYIQERGEVNIDPLVVAQLEKNDLDYAATINTGFFCLPKGSLDPTLISDIAAALPFDKLNWFCETTLIAALIQAASGKPLSRERYIVSTQRQFYFEDDVEYSSIAARHFVTPVRHVMYKFAMPYLIERWSSSKG